MKLRVTVKPYLELIAENETKEYGEVFEVSQERGIEILKTVFDGKPVVELIPQEDSELDNLKAESESLIKENEELKAQVLKLKEENEELNQKIIDLTKDNKKNNKKDEGKGEENE